MNLKTMVEKIHQNRPFTPYSLHMIFYPMPMLILGAYFASTVNWFLLGLLIIGYWIGLEVGVHNLDLAPGWRPKAGSRWSYAPWNLDTKALWGTASQKWGWGGMIVGLAIGIYLVCITQWWLIFFVLAMLAIGIGYGKDIWPFHTYTGFGLAYGTIPCFGSYLLQVQRFDVATAYFWGVVMVSVAVGIASSILLSYLPRAANPVTYGMVGIKPEGSRLSLPEMEAKAMTMKGVFIMFAAVWIAVIGAILMSVGS